MRTETYIEKFAPCLESVKYLEQFETMQEAWQACERGDWMLSMAQLLGVDIKTLTLAKVECAETVGHLMKDKRSLNALEVARKFANGEATIGELNDAACDAYAASAAAYAAAAAADVAADAAYAADDAAYAAYAADDDAKDNNRQQTADICRKVLTEAVFNKLKEAKQ